VPVTPDRAEGRLVEEEILFDDRTADGDPADERALRYTDGAFKAKDAAGVFNLRQGAASDTKDVKVSANDTTPGFLEDKVVGVTPLEVTTLNDGTDEDLQVALKAPTQDGQVLLAVGSVFKVRTPLTSCDNWLSNDQGEMLAEEDDSAS